MVRRKPKLFYVLWGSYNTYLPSNSAYDYDYNKYL